MSGVRLTETAISRAIREAKASGKRIDLTDPEQRGLMLRVGKSGSVTWSLACKDRGKFHRIMIGNWPAIGLSAARAKARSLREDVRSGVVVASGAAADVMTLDGLFDLYETQVKNQGRGPGNKTWIAARRRLSSVLKSVVGLPLQDVTLVMLQRHMDQYAAHYPTSAVWTIRTIRPLFKWASAPGRQYVAKEFNELRVEAKPQERDRVLNADELVGVYRTLARLEANPYAACMTFILLTLLRRSEAENLRWQDVTLDDDGSGVVRIEATKNGYEHKVPLSRQAVKLLLARKTADVRDDDLVFTNDNGGLLENWSYAQIKILNDSRTSGWHRHDLRRTGATLLGEMGVDPHIIEAALNHVTLHSRIARIYNKSRYLPQVAEALQRLADKYDELVAKRP